MFIYDVKIYTHAGMHEYVSVSIYIYIYVPDTFRDYSPGTFNMHS